MDKISRTVKVRGHFLNEGYFVSKPIIKGKFPTTKNNGE